ncbi:MAG: hypothetical protein IT204_00250 [Fimbriimonadaceae bacterium]|nr:hypothetical protein [Fimbriimonadaceae bacterium]
MSCRLAVLASLLLAPALPAAQLSFHDDGVRIDCGAMGAFTLTWPALQAGNTSYKPVDKKIEGATATLRYEGGATVVARLEAGRLLLRPSGLPAAVQHVRQEMLVAFDFADGGKWQIGDRSAAFPAQQPATPHLYQGNETRTTLTDGQGRSLALTVPPYAYQQLTDNREWGWKIFAWFYHAPIANGQDAVISIVSADAGQTVVVVDRWGQDAAKAFPGKVSADAELQADVAADAAYYGSLQAPARGPYGGLPGSGQTLGLQKTGYFHVEQTNGRWVLVDPDGDALFHRGICSFQPGEDYTFIKGRESQYAWLPPYDGEFRSAFHPEGYWSRDTFSFYLANTIRKYQQPYDLATLQARMIDRVRRLGWNATGAFSATSAAHRTARFPWVSSLPLSEWQLGRHIPGLRGVWDPFDPVTVAKVDEVLGTSLPANANEPLVIGYFLANEQAWEDLPRVIPQLKGAPAKLELVKQLRAKYPDIAAFNTAWGTAVGSFDDLAGTGLPVATKAAAADMVAYEERFLDAYYRTIRDTFRKYDPHHLLLGDRWQPRTANNETLARICGQYNDIISLNYYTYAIDPEFTGRLHRWSGRPMLFSEFYWSSPSDTGLPGGNEVANQSERGLAYRTYVEGAAALGYVVGIEWFTLLDQARTGRFFERYTGEKGNTGIFSVTDRPYKGYLEHAVPANWASDAVLLGRQQPFVWDNPRFRPSGPSNKVYKVLRAPGPIKLDGSRNDFPGVPPELIPAARLVQGPDANGVEAAFWACWDDQHLYLLVHVTDPTPQRNDQTGANLWNGDGVEVFLGSEELAAGGPLKTSDRQLLLGAGPHQPPRAWWANAAAQAPVNLVVLPDAAGGGYSLEAAIPWTALGVTAKAALEMRFDLAIDDAEQPTIRRRQFVWNGTARNSGDRGGWGRAVLVQ